ncbi:hypothetical protein ScalyP_jg9983 [Parmales sp. scaly parma]|nr:hypothetical protein ScalyP_jg9983 [Parmales sp. scaly parma]
MFIPLRRSISEIIFRRNNSNFALFRQPSPLLAKGLVTGTYVAKAKSVDSKLALAQWKNYVQVFKDNNWVINLVPSLDDHPDGVFIEDNVVSLNNTVGQPLMMITRSKSDDRRAETTSLKKFLEKNSQPFSPVALKPGGFLEGGDVLRVGSTTYIGKSSRSDQRGIDSYQDLVNVHENVISVPVTKALHLKSCMTSVKLSDRYILLAHPSNVCEEMENALKTEHEIVWVPEIEGTAVVDLSSGSGSGNGNGPLLLSAAAPKTRQMLEEKFGYTCIAVDISEFEKMEGCVTCLSVRRRGL